MELLPSLLETAVSFAVAVELVGVGLLIYRMLRWPRDRSAGAKPAPARRQPARKDTLRL